MGVLVVYPEDGELHEVPSEVREISNNIRGAQLVGINGQGESSLYDAIDRILSRGDTVNGIWIIGHGSKYEIRIGSIVIDPWAVIMYVKALGANWVVFNSCDGDEFARMVRVATGVATASFPKEVEDVEARRFASGLARALSRNDGDLGKAISEVSPRGSGPVVFHPEIKEELFDPTLGKTMKTSNEVPFSSTGNAMKDNKDQEFIDLIHGLEIRLTVLETQTKMRLEQVLSELKDMKADRTPTISKTTWVIIFMIGLSALAYFLGLFWLISGSG